MRNNGCKKTQILNMFTSFTDDFVLRFASLTNAKGLWFTSFTNDFVLCSLRSASNCSLRSPTTSSYGRIRWSSAFASETLDFSLRLIVAVLTITVLLITSTVSQANIIGAWLFDEGSGNVLKDASGNGHDGVITGGMWIEGKFGKALEFDADTFIEVKDPKGVFNLSKELTIMIWAYLTALTECCTGIPRKADSKDAGGWVLHPTKEGGGYKMYLWAYIEGWKGVPSKTTIPFSKDWRHFAATYDGKTLKVYIDGKLDGEQAATGEITPGDGDLKFSKDCCPPQMNRTFVGALDESLIMGEVLPEADIQKLMNEGLKGILAVESRGKLAKTWGYIKLRRN
jgi:hypothetical protein